MGIRELILRVLKEDVEIQIMNLKNKYVGEGKPLTEDDFNKILEVSLGKNYLMSWLTKKVGTGIIKSEDIYKWKDYFEVFEKNKNKFERKDIHLYKTQEDVKEFISKVISILEADVKYEEVDDTSKYVSKSDIERLESSNGAKYLGLWNGYQVFQIWDSSENTWKLYRDILGRCRGRGRGARIEICTIASYDYFKRYLMGRGLTDYFVLFNLEDKKSPYQVHYDGGQFMNKDDKEEFPFNPVSFFEWLEKMNPKFTLKKAKKFTTLDFPYKGEGFVDEKNQKQGKFLTYNYDGSRDEIITYKNNKKNGPFVFFGKNGAIRVKGFFKNNILHGPYVEYYWDGEIQKKGVLNNGDKVGIWQFGAKGDRIRINNDVKKIYVDLDKNLMSGFSENKIIFVSNRKKNIEDDIHVPIGDTIFFYPDGSTKAIGKLISSAKPTGNWTFFDKNGKIISEGEFDPKRGRIGDWTDVLKIGSKKYIIESKFNTPNSTLKNWSHVIKVYDEDGYAIDKKTEKSIRDKFNSITRIDEDLFMYFYMDL